MHFVPQESTNVADVHVMHMHRSFSTRTPIRLVSTPPHQTHTHAPHAVAIESDALNRFSSRNARN